MIELATPAPVLPTNLRTVDEFEQWQQQYAHEGSYEFVRGRIVDRSGVEQRYARVFAFLTRLFVRTNAHQCGSMMATRLDSYLNDRCLRVPDLSYYDADQLNGMRRKRRQQTQFAIEILSESESFQDVTEKVQDYIDAGAILVWYVLPVSRKIVVYTSADESKSYKGGAAETTAPPLYDFQFTVSDLFA